MTELHPRNVYVASLPRTFTDADLLAMFEPYGSVISAKVMCDKNGVSRGFGFVLFAHAASADAAIQGLVGASIQGTRIQVRKAKATSNTSVNTAALGEASNLPPLVQYPAPPLPVAGSATASFVPIYPQGYPLHAPAGMPAVHPNTHSISHLHTAHPMLAPTMYAVPTSSLTGPSVMQYPSHLVIPGTYPVAQPGAPTLLSGPLGFAAPAPEFSSSAGSSFLMMVPTATASQPHRPGFSGTATAPTSSPSPMNMTPAPPSNWESGH